ncbi:MAG: flagellar biosynthetic protein FliO [Clostridiales bacterium]|nr:flagellar biosynthetic protein FliO [Clostridiales bacterium]
MGWETAGQFLYILLLVAFVAVLAYFSTKLLAMSRGGKFRSTKRNLEVIESIGVGAQSVVQIVRAGEKFYLIGVTKESVSLLAELDAETLDIDERSGGLPEKAFSNILKRFIKDKPEQPKEEGDERDA